MMQLGYISVLLSTLGKCCISSKIHGIVHKTTQTHMQQPTQHTGTCKREKRLELEYRSYPNIQPSLSTNNIMDCTSNALRFGPKFNIHQGYPQRHWIWMTKPPNIDLERGQ